MLHHELDAMLDGIDALTCVDMPPTLAELVDMTKFYVEVYNINPDEVEGTVEGLQIALDRAGVYTYISDNYFEVYGRWSENLQEAINNLND